MLQRHMFPGNNTSAGFFSYYQYMLPQKQADRIYCLKGGPGTGKSTFIKKIANGINKQGLNIEYLHCSSDPDSLDGIVIPALKTALFDATAPHVIDPVNPAAIDGIINLGEFWDAKLIRRNRKEIMQCGEVTAHLFKRAYRYLAAAKSLTDDISQIYDRFTDEQAAFLEAENVISKHLNNNSSKRGMIRKAFATGITPQGIIRFADTLVDESYDIYFVGKCFGGVATQLFERVCDRALSCGFDTEVYYCPMAPKTCIEHLIIPGIKLALLTDDFVLSKKYKGKEIDLEKYLKTDRIAGQKEAVEFDTQNINVLINAAVLTLKKAKEQHELLEGYYFPYMDFEKADKKADETLNEIINRI